MARVVVVGGGYGGLASSVRLAKLGHQVTLLEAGPVLGGALAPVTEDGFAWDSGPTSTLLPAVIRDLFRKSGRPVEDELELVPLDVVREHRFEDDTWMRLPGGSRAEQHAAFDRLGPGLGQQWLDHVAAYADDWEVFRTTYAEIPWDPTAPAPSLAALFDSREMMHRRLKRSFKDDRLRLVAAHPFVADGHDLRNVPAWAGLTAYLEQCFGAWTIPVGMAGLAAALIARLETRGVEVHTNTEVVDVIVREGRAVGVMTADGPIDADVVVCAIDPRRLATLAPLVERTMPALPPVVCHVGLSEPVSELHHEVVFHGDPMLVVRTGGTAPPGHVAWTIHGRGKLAEDILKALARYGVDVREQLVARVDRSPRDLVEQWSGSPLGVLWQGRGTVRLRLGPQTPIPGVYAAGAHSAPGSGLPFVGLSAALVAQVVGPA